MWPFKKTSNVKWLDDGIMCISNHLSPEECQKIISDTERANSWVETWTPIDRERLDGPKYRKCKMTKVTTHPELQQIDKLIFDKISSGLAKYHDKYGVVVNYDEGYKVLKYDESDYYNVHYDSSLFYCHRQVSVIIFLNDQFKGGELSFPSKKITVTPKQGSIVFFPSNYLYSHVVNKITSGTRYAIVTWMTSDPRWGQPNPPVME